MTSDEKEALRIEEACIKTSLARSMTALKTAQDALGVWITCDARMGDKAPPSDVTHVAVTLQLDVMALYRLRVWRKRFG